MKELKLPKWEKLGELRERAGAECRALVLLAGARVLRGLFRRYQLGSRMMSVRHLQVGLLFGVGLVAPHRPVGSRSPRE